MNRHHQPRRTFRQQLRHAIVMPIIVTSCVAGGHLAAAAVVDPPPVDAVRGDAAGTGIVPR